MSYRKSKLELMAKEAERKSLKDMWAVRSHQPAPERLAKVALGTALKNEYVREFALRHSKTSRNFPGFKRIGEGEDQIVYTNGQRVIKVLHCIADRYPLSTLTNTAEMLQKATDAGKTHMGRMWLSTFFNVIELPASGEEAIIAEQPYVHHAVTYRGVGEIATDRRLPSSEKREYADRAESFFNATGMRVDVLGPNNICTLRESPEMLVQIDTIPMSVETQRMLASDGRTLGDHAAANLGLLHTS